MTEQFIQTQHGIRAVQVGTLSNAVLAIIKLVAGIVGNSYAVIADAIESAADIFTSLVVWSGLHIAEREPDDEYLLGNGNAESLATAVVALLLLGAAVGIAVQTVREILTPHGVRTRTAELFGLSRKHDGSSIASRPTWVPAGVSLAGE